MHEPWGLQMQPEELLEDTAVPHQQAPSSSPRSAPEGLAVRFSGVTASSLQLLFQEQQRRAPPAVRGGQARQLPLVAELPQTAGS